MRVPISTLTMPPAQRAGRIVGNHTRLLALLAVLLAVWAYRGVVDCGFIQLDDDMAVAANPHLREGLTLHSIAWAFSTTYYDYWHPLPWLTYALDIQIWGASPRGYHLTNLLFHLVNVVLVLLFVRRLTRDTWIGAVAAALFAVHPVHVESVAWIVERKDVLACLCWYACLLAYLWYARSPKLVPYLATLGFMAMGMMAKPLGVMLPFVMLAVDWYLRRMDGESHAHERPAHEAVTPSLSSALRTGYAEGRDNSKGFRRVLLLLIEKIPFAIVAAFGALLTMTTVSASHGISDTRLMGPGMRLANAAVSCVTYLRTLVWPARLAIYYPYDLHLSLWISLAAGLTLALLVTLAFLARQRAPIVWFGALWFLLCLVPVIGLVQTGSQARADRFLYIPALGAYVIAASALVALSRRGRAHRYVAGVIALGIFAALGLTAQRYVACWRTTESLFTHTLQVTKDNWFVEHNYGVCLMNQGRDAEALTHLRASASVYAAYPAVWTHLGLALSRCGRHDEAIAALDHAVALDAGAQEAQRSLATALQRAGRFGEAAIHYRLALSKDSGDWVALNNLGLVLDRLGQRHEAGVWLRRAVAANPSQFEACYNLGTFYLRTGDFGCACATLTEALRLRALDSSTLVARAVARANLGDTTGACADYALAGQVGGVQITSSDLAVQAQRLLTGACSRASTAHARAAAACTCLSAP